MMNQKELIYSSDWDLLIILDACRYDVFKELYGNMYKVEPAWSSGSCTPEWFLNTFKKKMEDVIYVSGNPFITSKKVSHGGYTVEAFKYFFRVIDAWNRAWRKIGNCYTCDPKTISFIASTIPIIFPQKRIIVHFIQPHAPYVKKPELAKYFTPDKMGADQKLWKALREGKIPKQIAWEGYKENLKFVMQYAQWLINKLKGWKYVITSDHGECFGENGIYNHPCGNRNELLRTVPWAIPK